VSVLQGETKVKWIEHAITDGKSTWPYTAVKPEWDYAFLTIISFHKPYLFLSILLWFLFFVAGVCTALSSNLAFVEKAGGQSFHCANSFTVSWSV